MVKLATINFIVFTALASSVAADDNMLWGQCGPVFVPGTLNVPQQGDLKGETRISADEVKVHKREFFQLKGRVQLDRKGYFLSAEQANYHRGKDWVEALGTVRFETEDFFIIGDKAKLDLKQSKGELSGTQFWLPQNHLRGKAQSIQLNSSDSMSLSKALFTSCNENDEVWKLRASELRLDKANNEAVVYHARLELFDTPILYFPYLNLPIEGRKTGLLIPNMGYSNESGSEYAQPFYWNIAPNRDATLVSHFFSKRGIQAKGEFRYLTDNSSGKWNMEYLPDDKIYGEDRSYLALNQSWSEKAFDPSWRANIYYRRASDVNYLKDFGGGLNLSSLSYLERQADVSYKKLGWQVQASAQHFQILDSNINESDKPTQLLPQFQLNSPWFQLGGLDYGFQTQWVRFDRQSGLEGQRSDLNTFISWPMNASYGFLKPTMAWRYTHYQLRNNLGDSSPRRSIPMASVDSGLFFERKISNPQGWLRHTLEPRLFYLYVPYKDQNGLLVDQAGNERVFDSSASRFDFAQLFRSNRYMGLDRIGDTNQLTLALSSRILNPSGAELFSVSLGQIRYFADRRVSLPGGSVETLNRSDVMISLFGQLGNSHQVSTEFVWDDHASETIRGAMKYRFTPDDENQSASVAYRYEKNIIEQADIHILLPFENQWKFVALWNYSLMDDLTLENQQGIQYESCCWALRLLRRETIEDLLTKSYNDSFLIQFELKGLASVGGKAADFFLRGQQ